MPFDNPTFALECVKQGRYLGVSPHYLMMVAELRSKLSDTSDGDNLGAYRVTQVFWDANSMNADFEILLQPDMITSWRLQCLFAASLTRRLQNELIAELSDEGRYPTVLELYQAQWPDAAGIPAAQLAPLIDAALTLTSPLILAALQTDADGMVPETATHADSTQPANPPKRLQTATVPHNGEQLFISKAPVVMERLMNDFGLKDYEAAGVLGNIGHECGGFNVMLEVKPKSGRGGLGWCQWTGPRRLSFEAFCAQTGFTSDSDEANYGYLRKELQTNPYKGSIASLHEATTLAQAVRNFERIFEAAGTKLYDRRERWATLALGAFARKIPANVGALADTNASTDLIATAKADGSTYWLLAEHAQGGGHVLIAQPDGQDPKVLARDSMLVPLPAGLVPEALVATLSPPSPVAADTPAQKAVGPAASVADLAARVLASATICNETLVTKTVSGTHNGHLACAWAVNEVVKRARGQPIGGGTSTAEMAKVLARVHEKIDPGKVAAGMVVISPTQGRNVGHVGIVGELKSPLDVTPILSNSSKRGVFAQNYTLRSWTAHYKNTNGLPVDFYRLKP